MVLVDYMNCTDTLNPASYAISSGTPSNSTAEDSTCLPKSIQALRMFFIPATICSLVALLANPMILITILKKDKLRTETRYILLANVMISDLIFLLFNLLVSACNIIRWYVHRLLCFTMIICMVSAYASCVLTFTFMVIDTYIAICFPLHYYSLLSVQRTRKILLAIWIFSFIFPLLVLVLSESFEANEQDTLNICLMFYYGPNVEKNNLVTAVCSLAIFFLILCSVMITYFYIRLYRMTRQSEIWVSKFSRARITLLTHSTLLCLYIVPAFILTAEIMLFKNSVVEMEARMWISAANSGLIMLMPRAMAPLLYGLRYREISTTLKLWLSRNKVSFTDSFR
ncbi:putative G-protein coupled receptor 148 [Gastrophryne carolinensis]